MNDWRSDWLEAMDHAVDELEELAGAVVAGVEGWAGERSLDAAKQFDRLVEFSVEWSDQVVEGMTDAVANAITDVMPEALTDALTNAMTDVMTQVSAEFSTQTQTFLDTDLDAFLNLLIHPFTVESLEDWINVTSTPNQYSGVAVRPHPLCADCKNFHGQAYNDVSLVCGMHPYGIVEGQEKCSDREL